MLAASKKQRQELINQVIDKITRQYSTEQTGLLSAFAQNYYGTVAYEDLRQKSPDDLLAILLSHWKIINLREPGEIKVRIFNPRLDQDGWKSQHTAIQISCDNMPFIVDSVRSYLNRQGLLIHFMVHTGGINLIRNHTDKIAKILSRGQELQKSTTEAPVFIEIDHLEDKKRLQELTDSICAILQDVTVVVSDWSAMREHLQQLLVMLEQHPPQLSKIEITESCGFLRWILQDNFIFLGCRDYRLIERQGKKGLHAVPGTGLGILRRKETKKISAEFSALLPAVEELLLSPQILFFAKTNNLSTVHRGAYTDYVGIKHFDEHGKVIGETRFVGLYTLEAYHSNPDNIPFLRHKIARVLQESQFNLLGYAGKSLREILRTLPRDDLFQASIAELLDLSLGILHLQERQRTRLFVRKDVYGRYFSCLVYIPRDRFNMLMQHKVQHILMLLLHGKSSSFTLSFLGSALVCLHFMIRIDSHEKIVFDIDEIEHKIIQAGQSWKDVFRAELVKRYGEIVGLQYADRYQNSFPAGYREEFSPLTAIHDIAHIEKLSEKNELSLHFYETKRQHHDHKIIHLKLFRRYHTICLSDVLPMLEHMGLKVIDECPHQIVLSDGTVVWLNDFEMIYQNHHDIDISKVTYIFQEAFEAVWCKNAENDNFNCLVLAAHLNWREVAMLRAYAKYLRQIGFTFSKNYIGETLKHNANIARYLVDLFTVRFDPANVSSENISSKILTALDAVKSLDQDRILRRYLEIIQATTRTNYFQTNRDGSRKAYLSFKFDSAKISNLPLPHPKYEVFVYAPEFEGVHLRSARVARGGIRWSSRLEDFRVEILGLVKAQQVKNAVIVPHGAKGGFVVKNLLKNGGHEVLAYGMQAYRNFIRGLLDLTDNLQDQQIVQPADTVCHDDADSYLVVAADKGTATFSDIANEISKEYQFWLGDAFASGGSTGYDHKEIGITAKGVWESVKRHFRHLNVDTQQNEFTVVGIGDMSGDVFGNGMLLSKHIRLVAAFNHQHIFIDPNPDPQISFAERHRLFKLPHSTWEDYAQDKISTGGGVFDRAAKFVKLSPEIKRLLGIVKDILTPAMLIQHLLSAEVDLLFNGGIGTFIKASSEAHLDVGDRANDSIRIDADELRCKVVAEGGNLGLTQLARVEYALGGGRIYTDFIDNSAGVDCSDHEVNIKILLNGIMAQGIMTRKQRNRLLHEMTHQVVELVLENNYRQTQAIDLILHQGENKLDLFVQFISDLEQQNKINRALEFLPDKQEIARRKAAGVGLTAPEMAILLAYSKIVLKEEVLDSKLLGNPILKKIILFAFPNTLRTKYYPQMRSHSLHREIVATQLCNHLVNEMGVTFVYRMKKESGASLDKIITAFVIAKMVFNKDKLWKKIESLDLVVNSDVQLLMLRQIRRLIRRGTRWFLRNRLDQLNIESTVAQFIQPMNILSRNLPKYILPENLEKLNSEIANFVEQGVPQDIAHEVVYGSVLLSALDVIQAMLSSGFTLRSVAPAYFKLGALLELDWFRAQIVSYPIKSSWDAQARVAFKDDLDHLQRELTIVALVAVKHKSAQGKIERWIEKNSELLERWRTMAANIRLAKSVEPVMISVALRELLTIVQAYADKQKKTDFLHAKFISDAKL
ncbi:MAG: NAD-glutamate dehydrogenase [Gammaproteobacteria bacterium]|jgi:glutamate dehydrogenase